MAIVPAKKLSLFDSTCIIVGIIIGAGIYETAPMVAGCMGSGMATLGIWLVGGILALTGALCYAELATAYPMSGGDYVYLTRAYGRCPGFLFGWSQMAIVRPGDIALMAFIFARYVQKISSVTLDPVVWASLAIVILMVVNILGVREGKWTQNVLTVLKVVGLLAIIGAGLFCRGDGQGVVSEASSGGGNIKLALILVLFTYGGWNEMAYVAAEVKRPKKNILRALLLGTVAVTMLYLLANLAFIRTLGYDGMVSSKAVAVDSLAVVMPDYAAGLISALICISTLGAINGLTFTGARISWALGSDHSFFGALGQWHPKLGTPVIALMVQGIVALVIVLLAGSFIDTIIYAAPVVWLFFLATGLSLFWLRRKDSQTIRPYKVTAYPIVPMIFCGACGFMLWNSITYAMSEKPYALMIAVGIVVLGVIVYTIVEQSKPEIQ